MSQVSKLAFVSVFPTVLMIFYYGCSDNSRASKKEIVNPQVEVNYRKKNFDSLLEANKAPGLDYYGELLANKTFVDVLEHDSLYLNDATVFLTKNNFTQDQVSVCLCAMQMLKPENYVKFSQLLLNLYDQGKILGFTLIEYAIWSPPQFLKHHRIIVENYKNPEVITFLKSVMSDKKAPMEFKKQIPDILSGKTKDELENFD